MSAVTLVAWLLAGLSPQVSNGSVEGIVLRTGTGTPIEGVRVTLTSGPAQFSAFTDEDGRFEIANVASGPYVIRVQRDGYFNPLESATPLFPVNIPEGLAAAGAFLDAVAAWQAAAGGASVATVNVAAGQRVTGLRFALTPGGTISGRILDAMGRPAIGAIVAAMRLVYSDGRAVMTPARTATSNDRGEYRLYWLEAGEYYVRAEKEFPSGPARGYFPGVESAGSAVRIVVNEGEESPKIDVVLQDSATVTVSGAVTNLIPGMETLPASPTPAVGASIAEVRANLRLEASADAARNAPQFYLSPLGSRYEIGEPAGALSDSASAQDRAAGRFQLRNVKPGSYDLYAVVTDRTRSPQRQYAGRARLDVGLQDVEGVAITIAPGGEVTGTVVYNGAARSSDPPLSVQLRSRTPVPGVGNLPAWAEVRPDGTFTIPDLADGEYAVSLIPSAQGLYISELRQGDFSVFDTGLVTVGPGFPSSLQITVSSPPAAIAGRVFASPEELAAGVDVVLAPEEPRHDHLALYRRAPANLSGEFTVPNVTPGTYRLLAFESIPRGAEQNAEYMEAYRFHGIRITAAAGDSLRAEIPVIPKRLQ